MVILMKCMLFYEKDDNEMKEVDARGLSCPEPIMLTAEAIKGTTEPVKVLIDFTEQFQNGYSGYSRFLEIMAIAPDIKDVPDAVELGDVKGEIAFAMFPSAMRRARRKWPRPSPLSSYSIFWRQFSFLRLEL